MTYPDQPGGYDPYDPYGQQNPPYQQPASGYPAQPPYGPPAGQPVSPYAPPPFAAAPHSESPPQPPGARPVVVTIGAMLVVLHVVINVAFGVLLSIGLMEPGNTIADQPFSRAEAVMVGIAFIAVGLGFIGMALGILRGHSAGRITAFIVYGLVLIGCGCLGGLMIVGLSTDKSITTGDVTMAAVICLALFLSYLAVVVLLALPAANRWFRQHSVARRAGVIR